jgi:hypothetical protein
MGLVILGAIALYLIVSLVVVVLVAKVAKKQGRSPWRWGGAAALVMYLLVFWDHIPTVVAHRYYCEKEAGFWVYKTVEQWKAENPGVAETLVANRGAPSKRQGDMENYTDTYSLSSRFNWIVKHNGQFLFNRWRHEQEVVDVKTGDVLGRYVDFSTSQIRRQAGWSGWKMWLDVTHCSDGAMNQGKMGQFMLELKNPDRRG